MPDVSYSTYAEIKERLDEVVAAASDDEMPIDDALALYEEAVKLGLAASDLIERDIAARDATDDQAPSDEGSSSSQADDTDASELNGSSAGAAPADDVAPRV